MIEPEGLVHHTQRLCGYRAFDQHRDLDFGGGDHLDVDTGMAEGLEHLGGDTGVAAHADADGAEFGDAAVGAHGGAGQGGEDGGEGGGGFDEVVFVEGERDVRLAVEADVLDDHVDVEVGVGEGEEDLGGVAGLVGHAADGDFGLIAFDADAADDDGFHAHIFFRDKGSRVFVHRVADLEFDPEFFGELD